MNLPNGDRPSSIDSASLYASLGVHKGLLPSEFNIQSEEFPALPGASGRDGEGRQNEQQSANPSSQVDLPAHKYLPPTAWATVMLQSLSMFLRSLPCISPGDATAVPTLAVLDCSVFAECCLVFTKGSPSVDQCRSTTSS